VVKFAILQVAQLIATGNPKGIEGMFVRYFSPGPLTGGDDRGWSSIELTQ
jgi:hypothetical protein